MLLSMTGFGEARGQNEQISVTVEVRTINSRHFKLSIRMPDGYASFEPNVDAQVRKHVSRGTIQVNLRIARHASPDDYRLNTDVLNHYRSQLAALDGKDGRIDDVELGALLALPGVVEERNLADVDTSEDWPIMSEVLESALEGLDKMRQQEGAATAEDMRQNAETISTQLAAIKERAPAIVEDYRQRLTERLTKTLAEFDVELDTNAIIREVSLFAERGDISEEIVRLESHLEQFGEMISGAESVGKKLEFLGQEMLRETNTIGSKANDVAVARNVIEIKSCLERIREQVQNIE